MYHNNIKTENINNFGWYFRIVCLLFGGMAFSIVYESNIRNENKIWLIFYYFLFV